MSIWPDAEDHRDCERSSRCMKLIAGSVWETDACDLDCDSDFLLCPVCASIRRSGDKNAPAKRW